MEDEYVEGSRIILPRIADGVSGLGDLWDCNSSKYVGFNLFGKKLKGEHMKHLSRESQNYQLVHIKSSKDKLNTVNIEGSLALELLAGLIKVEGSGSYDKNEKKNMYEERLSYEYKRETYSVTALPKAKEAMDELVTDLLMNGKIKATHVVSEVYLGADVDASITIKQIDETDRENIGGKFEGKLEFGPVKASVKASMEWIDSNAKDNYELRIVIRSKPPIHEQPKTMMDMFNAIENIGTYVNAEKHYEVISDEIVGVPIRFVLVPITQYLDMKVEKLYKQLRDEVFEKFSKMLHTLRDFGVDGFVRSKAIEKKPPLIMILSDPTSSLSKNIAVYEKELQETTGRFLQEAMKTLHGYKNGEYGPEALLELANNFEKELNTTDVYATINDFVQTGENDLVGVNEDDVADARKYVKFFTNEAAVYEWFNSERNMKILMRTKGTSPSGVFRRLYDITPTLSKLGVEIGVAIPSISDNFTMSIKIHDRLKTYDADEIPYVLTVIMVCIGVASPTEMLFYKLNADRIHQHLPLASEELTDLQDIIDMMEMCRKVNIPESDVLTLGSLRKKDDVWKFFIPLKALDTVYDAVEKVVPMIGHLTTNDSNWIVGNIGSLRSEAAPLLIVIRDAIVRAVCMDNLDLLILTKQFAIGSNPDLSMLSPDHLINSLYPERARYTAEFLNLFNPPFVKKIDASKFSLTEFANEPEQNILNALKVLRISLTGDPLDVISTVTSITVKSFPTLIDVLNEYGWIEGEQKFSNKDTMNKTKLESLRDKLVGWFERQLPFLPNIETAIGAIKDAQVSNLSADSIKRADGAITAIFDNPICPKDLREKMSPWMSKDPQIKFPNIIKVLDEYKYNIVNNEKFFNVIALKSLITDFARDNQTQYYIHNIIPLFVEKVKPSTAQYINFDRHIANYIQNKQYYQLMKLLAKLTYDHKLYMLHQEIDQLHTVDDMSKIANIITKMLNAGLNEEQWKKLWLNIQFEHLIRCGIDDGRVLEAIAKGHDYIIPNFIPNDIRGRLQKIVDEHKEDLKIPSTVGNINELLQILNRILQRRTIPEEFYRMLNKSVTENENLQKNLAKAGALYYWDAEENTFYEKWGLATISRVVEKLNSWKDNK